MDRQDGKDKGRGRSAVEGTGGATGYRTQRRKNEWTRHRFSRSLAETSGALSCFLDPTSIAECESGARNVLTKRWGGGKVQLR